MDYLAGIHKNILAPHLDFVAIHSHSWVLLDLPRSDVILPAMPRAGHHRSVQDSLSQRPAPMQASVVNRVVFPPHIRQGYGFAFHLEFPDRSWRDLIRLSRPHERHRLLFPPSRVFSAFCFLLSAYLGSGVCATITPFLKSSTISGFSRIS